MAKSIKAFAAIDRNGRPLISTVRWCASDVRSEVGGWYDTCRVKGWKRAMKSKIRVARVTVSTE